MLDLISAKESTLAELLRNGRFTVPRHQRYYDWEEEHVNVLLNDLEEAVDENSPCHFLGSIMLIKEKGKGDEWEINDGQQRIITFSLICAYLCRDFHARGYSADESNILRVLFDIPEAHNKTLQDSERLTLRVVPPISDKENFNHLVRGNDIGTNGKMTIAWNKISSFFNHAKHQDVDWRKKTLDFLLNKFIIIRLQVDKSLDANAIFETLNYRGKYLEQVDLMKNYFLSFFNTPAEYVRSETMHDSFEKIYSSFNARSVFGSRNVSEYFRCFMQTKYGFINKERFFRETKKRFGSISDGKSEEIFDLVNEIAENERIQIFKTFLQKTANQEFLQKLTDDARKGNNKRKINDYLLDLHGYTITRPIVFSLFCLYFKASGNQKRKTAKFVYACTKILSSFVQRVSHIGDFRPSAYEEKFANLAAGIANKSCTTEEQFFEEIKNCDSSGVIDDVAYMEQMKTQIYLKKSISKSGYILKRIVEYQENGVKIIDNQVSVEHILPKSAVHNSKTAWASKFDELNRDRLVHCPGNLTLLSKNENSPKSNDNESFSVKKKIYKKSSYKMTRELCVNRQWTPDSVRKRHRQLVKIAAKSIWNFDF